MEQAKARRFMSWASITTFYRFAVWLLSIATSLCATNSASSANITVAQLREICASPNGSNGQTICSAYLMGVVHGLQLGTHSTKRGEPFCNLERLAAAQAIDMFTKFSTDAKDGPRAAATRWAEILLVTFVCKP